MALCRLCWCSFCIKIKKRRKYEAKRKNVLSKEEKAELKQENKYKIFRNKVMAIVCLALFIASAVATGLSDKYIENDFMYILGAVGTCLCLILLFFIFRKPSLAFMATGAARIDVGSISKTLTYGSLT